ncbi:MAG: hypothetical protein ACQEQ7_03880 [Thermodesulfobacteriota bacterium]
MAGYAVRPPIPVENIIERALGLRLLYEDLEKVFGHHDVLGAMIIRLQYLGLLINKTSTEMNREALCSDE